MKTQSDSLEKREKSLFGDFFRRTGYYIPTTKELILITDHLKESVVSSRILDRYKDWDEKEIYQLPVIVKSDMYENNLHKIFSAEMVINLYAYTVLLNEINLREHMDQYYGHDIIKEWRDFGLFVHKYGAAEAKKRFANPEEYYFLRKYFATLTYMMSQYALHWINRFYLEEPFQQCWHESIVAMVCCNAYCGFYYLQKQEIDLKKFLEAKHVNVSSNIIQEELLFSRDRMVFGWEKHEEILKNIQYSGHPIVKYIQKISEK